MNRSLVGILIALALSLSIGVSEHVCTDLSAGNRFLRVHRGTKRDARRDLHNQLDLAVGDFDQKQKYSEKCVDGVLSGAWWQQRRPPEAGTPQVWKQVLSLARFVRI